ncbi:MAG TPA: GNAT family N-acetyltransferase [Acidimicrobiales bacterium]|jgi:aminoglycoside 6'-N-acetyltransferase|nr:GNAT family N-acetyltransferase [Acidimicrobiales bacterium]
MVTLRPMQLDDLGLVRHWLAEPHVARWFLAGSSLERELEDIRLSVTGAQPVHLLVALDDDRPIGWCQWYVCEDNLEWSAEIGAAPGDVGVDYAIGEPTSVGRGLGTDLIAALVAFVRAERSEDCVVMADPEAHNVASRRVLEKNGFELVAEKAMACEPTDDPMAIYRLAAASDSAG